MMPDSPSPPNAPLAPPPPRTRGRQAGISTGFAYWLSPMARGTHVDGPDATKPRVRVCRACSGPGSARPWWDWRPAQVSGLCVPCEQRAAKETR